MSHEPLPEPLPDDPAVVLGKVKWFSNDRGWGFITVDDPSHEKSDNGGDVFVYYSAIADASSQNNHKSLAPGERVAFTYRAKTSETPIRVRDVAQQRPLYIQCPVAVRVFRTVQALEEDSRFERARDLAYRLLDQKAGA